MKPVVGITVNSAKIAINFSKNQEVELVAQSYIDIVKDHGGIPVLLSNSIAPEDSAAVMRRLSGLMLTGGEDLQFTGTDGTVTSPSARDKTERALYLEAKKRKIPVLGICRGMQLINIAESGTLYEDLPATAVSHFIEPDSWIPYHSIRFTQFSKIAHLMGVSEYFTSSVHHQGIKKLGDGLLVSAAAEDGLPEIIEGANDHYVVGIQGHAEKTRKNLYLYERIFEDFMKHAAEFEVNHNGKEQENADGESLNCHADL